MTVVVAARLLILVQGFSSKVEWAAKTNHASIEVAALNCIKSFSAQAPDRTLLPGIAPDRTPLWWPAMIANRKLG